MANIRDWFDKRDNSSTRMVALEPILIRHARLDKPITYGDVAREFGVHYRAFHHIVGYIGFTRSIRPTLDTVVFASERGDDPCSTLTDLLGPSGHPTFYSCPMNVQG